RAYRATGSTAVTNMVDPPSCVPPVAAVLLLRLRLAGGGPPCAGPAGIPDVHTPAPAPAARDGSAQIGSTPAAGAGEPAWGAADPPSGPPRSRSPSKCSHTTQCAGASVC